MSFIQNGRGRYGYVPPARYGTQPIQNPGHNLQRQSSFDSGDDASFFDNTTRQGQQSPSGGQRGLPQDELFMDDTQRYQGPPRPSHSIHSPVLSGFQHQYQSHPTPGPPPTSTYNPQQFVRTQSQYQASNTPYTLTAYPPPAGFVAHQPYNPAVYSPAPLQRQQTLPSSQSYNTPLLQVSGPSTPGYWAQYSTLPPPQRPIYQQTQSAPYVPSSTLQPTSTSAYTPPISSTPYPVNGGGYSACDLRTPTASQPPYPNEAQAPTNPYSSSIHDSIQYTNRAPSVSPNPLPMPLHPSQPPINRHPTHRPLPNAPVEEDDTESEWDEDQDGDIDEKQAQEQIYKEIEAVVGTGSRDSRNQVANQHNGDLDNELGDLHRFNSQATTLNPTRLDRSPSVASTVYQNNQGTLFPYDDDESDAEAAAGLEAMRIAEEQDARRGSGGNGLYDPITKTAQPPGDSSDSDYANIDMGLVGGGYDARMSYGDGPTMHNTSHLSEMEDQSRPLPTLNELHRSGGTVPVLGLGGMTDYSLPGESSLHPFPDFGKVDASVGSTAVSQPHRLSFDDGDEQESISSRFTESRLSGRSGSESPTKDDIQEMFYHPGMSPSVQRPLPAIPNSIYDNIASQSLPVGRNRQHPPYSYANIDTSRQYIAPDKLEVYTPPEMLSPPGQLVPRSASLSNHSYTPQVVPPVRSRTDAEERQARQKQLRQHGSSGASLDGFDISTTQSTIPLDLPSLPLGRRRKISPANLRSTDFKKCKEPWALSNLAEWLKEMCGGENGEGESDLREKTVAECLVALFTHKVSTMNTADAETLSDRVVKSMFEAGVILPEEEWVKFGQGTVSGVLWQLTGSGCYAPKIHEHDIQGRCYSHLCHRTLRRINLNAQLLEPSRKSEDWNIFFKVTKEQMDAADRKEIQRQYNLHEIVMSEDKYMDRLNVLRVLYRDELKAWQPPIIGPSKLPRFIAQVFGKVEAIKKTNEEYLLRELKFRQQEQGPWIIGFSDIFREWIRKARQVYMEYASGFPQASHMVRKEAEKNLLFRQFLNEARENKLSDRLDWNTYLYAPLKRLQQYTLLLREVHKHSYLENDEKANIAVAIDEINSVTLECDAKVDEMSKKVEMIELSQKLYLRPGMEGVELNLDHLGRRLIFKGDLQRAGNNRFNWLETHAILFDHYFVLAKTVPQRDASAGRNKERYDVSKLPIPMVLLVLESANDDPVVKSSVKGLGTVTTITRPAPSSDQRLSRMNTTGDRPNTLEHVNSNSSISTAPANRTSSVTNVEGDAKSMYPFRIKHLGKSEVYTLYAPTAANRQDWCDKIIEAKEHHAASLFAQNAEPFRLKIMADTSFAYDAASAVGKGGGIPIKGTPLDRAIREMEREYGPVRPAPVCRAMVNCATTFKCSSKDMVAIGTDYGVYISELSNPRGWTRSIQMSRVTQIEVLEDFSLGLIIADKSLIAYHLDILAPVSNFPAPIHDSPRRAPQKLSGARDVSFFATARMKDRTLVFYKKREGLSSTFKVLEPVFQKSSEKKSKLFSRSRLSSGGSTEFFREFDEFYIPTECFTINLFHTYIAVSTARGFELLTLDKKVTMSIPDLKEPSIATIAARLTGQKPLGMFRKSETEFLLCYEECGVYVDKHGEVSRSVVLEFIGKAKSAAMYGAYLILFDNDFVEVRNAENGRLRQVIAGKDVRCIDYGVPSAGQGGQRTIKFAMAHPEIPASQLVLELELNEGQRE